MVFQASDYYMTDDFVTMQNVKPVINLLWHFTKVCDSKISKLSFGQSSLEILQEVKKKYLTLNLYGRDDVQKIV